MFANRHFIQKKKSKKGKKEKHDFKQGKLKKFQKIESAHLGNVIDKYFMNDIVPYIHAQNACSSRKLTFLS